MSGIERSDGTTSIGEINAGLGIRSGPGSSVGIATELRAGRSRIESRWGRGIPPV